jgi:hypothetical protein
MTLRWLARHKFAAGLSAVVVLGGAAGGAVAATQSSSSGRQAYLNDVAHRLGVSPSALTSALQTAAIDRIEAALAAGRLTQAEANALKQRVREDHWPLFGPGGFGRGLLHGGIGHGLLHGDIGRAGIAGVASRYLGVSPQALLRELRSGKSLAQIAESASGKSVEGLKAAIIAEAKKRLDAAVSGGRLSSKRENELLAGLSSRIQTLLQRSGPVPQPPGPGEWPGRPHANGRGAVPPPSPGASYY